MNRKLYLGLDIGSISINTVLMDDKRNIIENRYDFCQGKPFSLLKDFLSDIKRNIRRIHSNHCANRYRWQVGGRINWWSFCK